MQSAWRRACLEIMIISKESYCDTLSKMGPTKGHTVLAKDRYGQWLGAGACRGLELPRSFGGGPCQLNSNRQCWLRAVLPAYQGIAWHSSLVATLGGRRVGCTVCALRLA